MPTSRNGWTVYSAREVAGTSIDLATGDGPPEDFVEGWDELFDQTEFDIDAKIFVGFLTRSWREHEPWTVAVLNATTGELAVRNVAAQIIVLKERKNG